MKRKGWLILLTAGLIAAVGWWINESFTEVKKDNQPQEEPELVIGVMADMESVPILVAQEKGYFAQEEIKVALNLYDYQLEAESDLQQERIDGMAGDIMTAAMARQEGVPVKVTSVLQGEKYILSDKQFGNIQELQNRELAVMQDSPTEYLLDKALQENGMLESQPHKVVVRDEQQRLWQLEHGIVTAAVLSQPTASEAVDKTVLFDSTKAGIYTGGLIMREKSISDKRDVIEGFYRAYNRAVIYLISTPPEKVEPWLIGLLHFPEASRGKMRFKYYQTAELPRDSQLTEYLEWMKKKRLLKRSYQPDEILDYSFAVKLTE